MPERRFPPPVEPALRRTFLGREKAACSLIVCLRGAVSVSGKRRPARKSEAPNIRLTKRQESTTTCPKLLGQALQAHFNPLRDLPHRMFTLLMRLKNIRATRGERSALPYSSKKGPPTRKGSMR